MHVIYTEYYEFYEYYVPFIYLCFCGIINYKKKSMIMYVYRDMLLRPR